MPPVGCALALGLLLLALPGAESLQHLEPPSSLRDTLASDGTSLPSILYGKVGGGSEAEYLPDQPYFLVHKAAKLGMCVIPKAASTAAAGLFNELNYHGGRVKHYKKGQDMHHLSSVGRFKELNFSAIINGEDGWKWGIFLRDPVERYISAWLSKCTANAGNNPPGQPEDQGINCFGPMVYNTKATMEELVKAFEFRVEIDNIRGLPLNAHWLTQVKAMELMCSIPRSKLRFSSFNGTMGPGMNAMAKDFLNLAGVGPETADKYFPVQSVTGHCTSCRKNLTQTFIRSPKMLKQLKALLGMDYEFWPQLRSSS